MIPSPLLPLLALALLVALIATVADLRSGHIPNWLTFGAIVVGIAAQPALVLATGQQLSWMAALRPIAGAVLCALIPYFLFRKGGMGGGDVKLLAGVGALLGPLVGMEAELFSFGAAAIVGPAITAYRGQLLVSLASSGRLLINPFLPKAKRKEPDRARFTELRFGPCVLVGMALSTLLRTI